MEGLRERRGAKSIAGAPALARQSWHDTAFPAPFPAAVQPCPAGAYCPAGAVRALPCPAGFFALAQQSACLACRAGTTSLGGSANCKITCPNGELVNPCLLHALPALRYAPTVTATCISLTYASPAPCTAGSTCAASKATTAAAVQWNCPAGGYAVRDTRTKKASCVRCPANVRAL